MLGFAVHLIWVRCMSPSQYIAQIKPYSLTYIAGLLDIRYLIKHLRKSHR